GTASPRIPPGGPDNRPPGSQAARAWGSRPLRWPAAPAWSPSGLRHRGRRLAAKEETPGRGLLPGGRSPGWPGEGTAQASIARVDSSYVLRSQDEGEIERRPDSFRVRWIFNPPNPFFLWIPNPRTPRLFSALVPVEHRRSLSGGTAIFLPSLGRY